MAENWSTSANRSEDTPVNDRLDSWKEIAAYLRRDVTTVRRWERREGLPVYRHVHDKLGSVYAHRNEIDEWWQRRRNHLDRLGRNGAGMLRGRGRLAWTLVIVLLVTALVATMTLRIVHFQIRASETSEFRFLLPTPDQTTVRTVAVSPDGRQVAFTTSTPEEQELLWIRPLDSLAAQPLPGTEGAAFPFWSPDSRILAFFAHRKLKTITLSSRAVRTLCNASEGRGGTWNQDDVIVFASTRDQGLFRVSAAGGPVTHVTTVDRALDKGHLWPEFLPDGRHFLYLVDSAQPERQGVYVGALDGPSTKRLLSVRSNASYAPDGYLLFVRSGQLMAHPFDARRLAITGEAITVAERVLQRQYGVDHKGDFSASHTGVLAYRSGGPELHPLVWLDRTGKQLGTVGEPGLYGAPVLSPDEKRVAVARFDPDPRSGAADVWLLDLSSGASSRLTFDQGAEFEPVWSPDGRRILFTSNRGGNLDLYQKSATGMGTEEIVLASAEPKHAEAWSRDGRFLTYGTFQRQTESGRFHLWVLPLDRRPFPIVQGERSAGQSQISPDGRLIAYTSDESGRLEVYVQKFPSLEGKRQVSTSGGADPRWRSDGKELFYIAADRKLMAVAMNAGAVFEVGLPQPLFETRVRHLWEDARNHYDVTSDGKRFLFAIPLEDARSSPFTIVLNWTAGLQK